MEYVITEKQNVNSTRKGEIVEAKTLTAAKIAASKRQFYQGTVLTIHSPSGELLAVKKNGGWIDY